MPVFVLSLTLVYIIAKDGRPAAVLGHLPAERHGAAVTVQKRDPVRVGRDGCKQTQRAVSRTLAQGSEPAPSRQQYRAEAR